LALMLMQSKPGLARGWFIGAGPGALCPPWMGRVGAVGVEGAAGEATRQLGSGGAWKNDGAVEGQVPLK
jgi:hypothetical protein